MALTEAWDSLQRRRFPGSGEQLEDALADELSGEMAYQDSTLAGAVTTLLAGGETERRYLEPVNDVFNRLLAAGRERRSEHPDLMRVVDYADELERVRELALRLAR